MNRHTRNRIGALLLPALAMSLPSGLVSAAGPVGVPAEIDAKMNRLQAEQNRLAGSRHHQAPVGGLGVWSRGAATGGTGNLSIGDFSQSDIRGLREINILVDGDVVNLNRR